MSNHALYDANILITYLNSVVGKGSQKNPDL